MIDWETHYADLYEPPCGHGVTATLTLDDASTGAVEVIVIDHTAGEVIGDGIGIGTVRPVAYIRATELAENGITRSQLYKSLLEMNGTVWRITNTVPISSGAGEARGEYQLHLQDEAPTS